MAYFFLFLLQMLPKILIVAAVLMLLYGGFVLIRPKSKAQLQKFRRIFIVFLILSLIAAVITFALGLAALSIGGGNPRFLDLALVAAFFASPFLVFAVLFGLGAKVARHRALKLDTGP